MGSKLLPFRVDPFPKKNNNKKNKKVQKLTPHLLSKIAEKLPDVFVNLENPIETVRMRRMI